MRVTIPVLRVTRQSPVVSDEGAFAGVDSDPTNGHKLYNNGKTIIYATSDADAPVLLSFLVARKIDGRDVDALAVWVPAGEGVFVGPFGSEYTDNQGRVLVDVGGDAADVSLIGLTYR